MRPKVLSFIGGLVLVTGMSAVALAQNLNPYSNGQGQNQNGQGQNGQGVHHAPEIDPTLTATAVALLTGGVLVIRGRQRK